MKILDVLDELKKSYEPYAELAVSELQKVESLRSTWEQTKDPEWTAFRENPKTVTLFKAAVNTYRSLHKQMANDDGSLSQLERAKMDIGKKWAMFYIKALGGDPVKVRKETEREIQDFAKAAGIEM